MPLSAAYVCWIHREIVIELEGRTSLWLTCRPVTGTFNREKCFWKERRHHRGWLAGPGPVLDEAQAFLAQTLVYFTHISYWLSFLLLFLLLATLL